MSVGNAPLTLQYHIKWMKPRSVNSLHLLSFVCRMSYACCLIDATASHFRQFHNKHLKWYIAWNCSIWSQPCRPGIHILYETLFYCMKCFVQYRTAIWWKIVMWTVVLNESHLVRARFSPLWTSTRHNVRITGWGLERPLGQNAQRPPASHSDYVNKVRSVQF